jgi:single-strand DNA-binding protein
MDTFTAAAGNLTGDPELRRTPDGVAVASFRLAVTRRVREGGAWKDGETVFVRVRVWRQQAEHVVASLTKGCWVLVAGRLTTRTWTTANGETRSVIEIEADEVGPSLKWATARPEKATATDRAAIDEPPA